MRGLNSRCTGENVIIVGRRGRAARPPPRGMAKVVIVAGPTDLDSARWPIVTCRKLSLNNPGVIIHLRGGNAIMMYSGLQYGWLGGVPAQEGPLRGFPQNIPGWPVEPGWLNFLLTVVLFAALSLLAYWVLFSVLRNMTYRSRRRSD